MGTGAQLLAHPLLLSQCISKDSNWHHMGCWHRRRRLSLLYHNARSPESFLTLRGLTIEMDLICPLGHICSMISNNWKHFGKWNLPLFFIFFLTKFTGTKLWNCISPFLCHCCVYFLDRLQHIIYALRKFLNDLSLLDGYFANTVVTLICYYDFV